MSSLRQVVAPARLNHSRREMAATGLVGAISRGEQRDRRWAALLPRRLFTKQDAAVYWHCAVSTAGIKLGWLRAAGLVRWIPASRRWVRCDGFPG